MIQRTLVLLKPDALQRGIVGEIISRFERSGMKIVATKMLSATKEQAGLHYADDINWILSVGRKSKEAYQKKGIEIKETEEEIGRKIRNQLIEYLTMSPIFAMVLESHDAVAHVRKLIGSTAPKDAMPGTIRGDYSFDSYQLSDSSNRPIQNLIHASDSVESAEKEIKIWFSEQEIHSWSRVDEAVLYRSN